MKSDAYEELADWLVSTFRGLQGCKTQELMDILHHLYTPQEARLALQVGPKGGKLNEWASKTGMSEETLKPVIERMAEKGTIFVEPCKTDPVYTPLYLEAPGIIETSIWGDLESSFNKKKVELWGKYRTIYVNEGIAQLPQHIRAWCAVGALPPDARSEENLFEQIKRMSDDYIAVLPCACRLWAKHAGDVDDCGCILECCFSFGDVARWNVEQGHARHITFDEAVAMLRACEEKGQAYVGQPFFQVCCCCKHKCINSYAMKLGKSHAFLKNHFHSVANPEICQSCETCVKRCRFGAVHLEATAVVDDEKCMGCGLCAIGCKAGAMKMVRRSDEEIAKLDAAMMQTMAKVASISKPFHLLKVWLQNALK